MGFIVKLKPANDEFEKEYKQSLVQARSNAKKINVLNPSVGHDFFIFGLYDNVLLSILTVITNSQEKSASIESEITKDIEVS